MRFRPSGEQFNALPGLDWNARYGCTYPTGWSWRIATFRGVNSLSLSQSHRASLDSIAIYNRCLQPIYTGRLRFLVNHTARQARWFHYSCNIALVLSIHTSTCARLMYYTKPGYMDEAVFLEEKQLFALRYISNSRGNWKESSALFSRLGSENDLFRRRSGKYDSRRKRRIPVQPVKEDCSYLPRINASEIIRALKNTSVLCIVLIERRVVSFRKY